MSNAPLSLPRPVRAVTRVVGAPYRYAMGGLEDAGEQLSFYLRSLGWFYRTLISYKREVVRLIAEVSLGSGALALIGGSVVVLLGLSAAVIVGTRAARKKGLRP